MPPSRPAPRAGRSGKSRKGFHAQGAQRAVDRFTSVSVRGVLEHPHPRPRGAGPQRPQQAVDRGQFRRDARRLSQGAGRRRRGPGRGGEARGAGGDSAAVRARLLGLVLADHPHRREPAGSPRFEVAVCDPAAAARRRGGRPRRHPQRLCRRTGRPSVEDDRARDRRRRRRSISGPGRRQRRRDPGAGAQLRMGARSDVPHPGAGADRLNRACGSIWPASAQGLAGRGGRDPPRGSRAHCRRISARPRAAGDRGQSADRRQPRDRRARAHPGGQSRPCAQDAAQRADERGRFGERRPAGKGARTDRDHAPAGDVLSRPRAAPPPAPGSSARRPR